MGLDVKNVYKFWKMVKMCRTTLYKSHYFFTLNIYFFFILKRWYQKTYHLKGISRYSCCLPVHKLQNTAKQTPKFSF